MSTGTFETKTEKTWSTQVMQTKVAIDKLEKIMADNSKVGASDSEPMRIYQRVIRQTLQGQNVEIPATADGWSLYDISGSIRTASALRKQMEKIVKIMLDVQLKNLYELQQLIDGYCD